MFISRVVIRRSFSSKKIPRMGDRVIVPNEPIDSKLSIDESRVPFFSHELIARLEELSLVRFSDEEAVANLRESVAKASVLDEVNIEGVKPMHTVWESLECPLRDDEPEEQLGSEKFLRNVPLHRDGYIVAPQGNVPLEESDTRLDLDVVKEITESGTRKSPKLKKGRNTD